MRDSLVQPALVGLMRDDDRTAHPAFDEGVVGTEIETALTAFAVAFEAVRLENAVDASGAFVFLRECGRRRERADEAGDEGGLDAEHPVKWSPNGRRTVN